MLPTREEGMPAARRTQLWNISAIVWLYQGDESHPFHSPLRSSVETLPNGNAVITESDGGRLFEVTRQGEIVWNFVNPTRGGAHGEMVAIATWGQRIDPNAGTSSDWQVHGALGVGVGWSKNGGNSNWQTADINMNKTYATDDGGSGHGGVNISTGQYDGPFYGPGYGGGYYGPGPGPMSGPMPAGVPRPMPAAFGPAPTRR